MSFTSVFGGSTLQPADVAYRAVALSADTTLVWPPFAATPTDYAARTMDVTPSGAGLSLTLPPANQVSTGYDLLISNRGAFSFTVKGNAGATLVVIAPGESKYLQVIGNTSLAGTWSTVAFGAVTSAADAASLAGFGLAASGATLVSSHQVSTFSSNYTIVAADRAKTYVWTGGSGTLSLTAFGTLGSDFWFEVRNQGSGALTIDPAGAELINGASTIVLQPTESAVVHAGPAAWYTVGLGRSAQFNFSLLVKGITGGSTVLTSTEAANVVQRYTGVLVSNATITLPSVVQVYYVSNQTTGAFTVTFRTSGVGTTITVPQGQNAVLFCDGLNVINASTTVSGVASLVLSAGAVASPSLTYSGDTTTGLYQPVSGQVAVTISGVQRGLFSVAGLNVTGSVAVTGAGSFAGQLSAPGGLFLGGPATVPATTTGGLLSFENPVIREYIGDGTGYSRVWSRRIASVTTDLMRLSDSGLLGVGVTPLAIIHAKHDDIGLISETRIARGSGTNWLQFRDPTGDSGYVGFGAVNNHLRLVNQITGGEVQIFGATSGLVAVTADGRLYGTALHNNAGAVTGTTNQYIASGTYTPTPIAGTNTTVPGGFQGACWTRVGNVVTVSGVVTFSMTAASTFSEVDIPLPIASTNSSGLCNGTAVQDIASAATANLAACIGPSGIANRARFYIANASGSGATGNRTWRWQLTYLVE